MTIEMLRKVAELNDLGSKAMVTPPLRPWVQEEIDAGNLTTAEVRSGPLGLKDGSLFLILTDAGREKLKGSNVKVRRLPPTEGDGE